MKRVSLLLSTFFHLLVFGLLVWLSPSGDGGGARPAIITVVPMAPLSPPLVLTVPRKESPPRVPVYVRPFVIPGDGRPAGGDAKGRGSLGSPLPPAQPGRMGDGGERKEPPAGSPAGMSEEAPPQKLEPEKESDLETNGSEGSGRLKIAIDEIVRKWGMPRGKAPSRLPAGFGANEKILALPFAESSAGAGSGSGIGGSGPTAVGGSAFFDSRGYDVTPWAKRVVYRIKQNWLYPLAVTFDIQDQVEIFLVIARNGRISGIEIAKGSTIEAFNQAAVNALKLSVPFPPLPDDFPNPSINAYLIFRYN